jgi:hypothetical protein
VPGHLGWVERGGDFVVYVGNDVGYYCSAKQKRARRMRLSPRFYLERETGLEYNRRLVIPHSYIRWNLFSCGLEPMAQYVL